MVWYSIALHRIGLHGMAREKMEFSNRDTITFAGFTIILTITTTTTTWQQTADLRFRQPRWANHNLPQHAFARATNMLGSQTRIPKTLKATCQSTDLVVRRRRLWNYCAYLVLPTLELRPPVSLNTESNVPIYWSSCATEETMKFLTNQVGSNRSLIQQHGSAAMSNCVSQTNEDIILKAATR